MEMEGKSGVMQQQTKDCRGLLASTRRGAGQGGTLL